MVAGTPTDTATDTATGTGTDTDTAAPPAPTAAAVDLLVARLRLVAQSRYAPSRRLAPPPPPPPLLQDCLTHAAFALLSSGHYYKLPQPQPREMALSAFAPDQVRSPPGGAPATRRSATGRIETIPPTPPPPPPPVTSPPAASASGFGFYAAGGEGCGGGATIEGESPQQALRRIHGALSAAQAKAARWARLPAVVRAWARQRGPEAVPAAPPDRAATVEAVLAHAQLSALLLDPCKRLHEDVKPDAHVAAPLDILQHYESVFLASWEGVGGRDYFRRTCVPGYDELAEWCKCVAWLLECTPSVLHRPEHMRGPGGYESAGEERIQRMEAAQLAAKGLGAPGLPSDDDGTVSARVGGYRYSEGSGRAPSSPRAARPRARRHHGVDPRPSLSRQARFSRPFEAGHVTLVLARLDLPAASATAAALTVAATVDAERRGLLDELGSWRVCALQVELLPDYVALRPLEMWCDFPPFSGFDFTLDSVLAPAADAAADDSLDDASSEEEPAKPPPPSKSKTKTPKRG